MGLTTGRLDVGGLVTELSSCLPSLHLQGRPKEVLQVPAQSASLSALGGSVGGGLTDLAFFSGGGSAYTLAAGGGGGQVGQQSVGQTVCAWVGLCPCQSVMSRPVMRAHNPFPGLHGLI